MRSSAEGFEESEARLARCHIPEFCEPEICVWGGDDAYRRMGTLGALLVWSPLENIP